MQRRNARLRREYLYKKSLEGKEKEEFVQKEKVRVALATGAPLPTELRKDAEGIKSAIDLEDDRTAKLRVRAWVSFLFSGGISVRRESSPLTLNTAPSYSLFPLFFSFFLPLQSHVDDEYASAGYRDPKVCVITSRDPSSRLRQFAAEVRLLFPGAVRINRGGATMSGVVAAAKEADFTDIVSVHETRGEPDAMIISHLPYGPTVSFTLSGAVLRHDIEGRAPVSEAAPHLIFNNFNTPLGERVQCILKNLFPPPKPDSTRVLTFSNEGDFVSFRHHTFKNARSGGGGGGVGDASAASPAAHAAVTLSEVGPRWEMRPFIIRLGTLDQDTAEVEWQLRAFTNTARKKNVL